MLHKINTFLRFVSELRQHRKWLNDFVSEILRGVPTDESFTFQDVQKIKQYYGVGVPLVIGNMMSALHGRPLTVQEKRAFTALGAISGLYDDFFDRHQLSLNAIRDLTLHYEPLKSDLTNVRVYKLFLREIVQHVPNVESFHQSFLNVYEAQVQSLKQRESLPPAVLLDFSFQKGGYSLCFYREALHVPLLEGEYAFWFQTGALGQLCNDIFDMNKDQQEGIHTFANQCVSVKDLQKEFTTQVEQWGQALQVLPFPDRQKSICADYFSLGVLSRTRVCLQKLRSLEEGRGSYQPANWSRKDLVIDMERVPNILRQVGYYLI